MPKRRTALAAIAAALGGLMIRPVGAQITVDTTPVPIVPIPPVDGAGADAGPIRCQLGVCVPGNVKFNFTTGQLFAQARDCCWYELEVEVRAATVPA